MVVEHERDELCLRRWERLCLLLAHILVLCLVATSTSAYDLLCWVLELPRCSERGIWMGRYTGSTRHTDRQRAYIHIYDECDSDTNHPVGVLLLQQLSLPVGVETTTSPLALTTHSEVLLCNHGTVHPHHSRPVQYSNIALGSAVFALLVGDKQYPAKQSLSVRWVCDQSS